MPRIRVIADDGWVALDELATAAQLDGEHARRCLADRVTWAVEEAEARTRDWQPLEAEHHLEIGEGELQLTASG